VADCSDEQVQLKFISMDGHSAKFKICTVIYLVSHGATQSIARTILTFSTCHHSLHEVSFGSTFLVAIFAT
jgi:hypothetical protein